MKEKRRGRKRQACEDWGRDLKTEVRFQRFLQFNGTERERRVETRMEMQGKRMEERKGPNRIKLGRNGFVQALNLEGFLFAARGLPIK